MRRRGSGWGAQREAPGQELRPALCGLVFPVLLSLPREALVAYFWLARCAVVSLEKPSERPPPVLRRNVDCIFSSAVCAFFRIANLHLK